MSENQPLSSADHLRTLRAYMRAITLRLGMKTEEVLAEMGIKGGDWRKISSGCAGLQRSRVLPQFIAGYLRLMEPESVSASTKDVLRPLVEAITRSAYEERMHYLRRRAVEAEDAQSAGFIQGVFNEVMMVLVESRHRSIQENNPYIRPCEMVVYEAYDTRERDPEEIAKDRANGIKNPELKVGLYRERLSRGLPLHDKCPVTRFFICGQTECKLHFTCPLPDCKNDKECHCDWAKLSKKHPDLFADAPPVRWPSPWYPGAPWEDNEKVMPPSVRDHIIARIDPTLTQQEVLT